MSDENTVETTTETVEANESGEQSTQADSTDWKAEARKWEARAKENRKDLETITGERDTLTGQIADLKGKVTAFESEKERAEWVSEISKEKGVPGDALRGTTREELEAHADVLADLFKASEPSSPGQGERPTETPVDETREFARKLFKRD